MRKSKFTDGQVAFILKQAVDMESAIAARKERCTHLNIMRAAVT